MKRRLVIILIAALVMASAQANGFRSVGKTTSVYKQTVKQLNQLTKKVERVTRGPKPGWRTSIVSNPVIKYRKLQVVGIPYHDNDEKERSKAKAKANTSKCLGPIYGKVKKAPVFPKIKSPKEILDENNAKNYKAIKLLVKNGELDNNPGLLFYYADYAKRIHDYDFLKLCIERINSNQVTPQLLKHVAQSYPALEEYLPEISMSVTINAYVMMLEAKLQEADCDSARMQDCDTLLAVTTRYNPALNPLVKLSCIYEPTTEVARYKEAADSVIATYNEWSPTFKEAFASDFMITLRKGEEYTTALDYFGRMPLKEFPDLRSDFSLELASCSWGLVDDERFNHYLTHAYELDSVATLAYVDELYNAQLNLYIADPTQNELADWLIEYSNCLTPAEAAIHITDVIMDQYFPAEEETDWTWHDIADTEEKLAALNGMLYIIDHVATLDNSEALPVHFAYLNSLKAVLISDNPQRTDEALDLLANSARILDANPTDETNSFRCGVTIMQANTAGHGLDKPKEALKILNKNMKLLEAPEVSNETRYDWYDYMVALYTQRGKTKDAEKYRKLRDNLDL